MWIHPPLLVLHSLISWLTNTEGQTAIVKLKGAGKVTSLMANGQDPLCRLEQEWWCHVPKTLLLPCKRALDGLWLVPPMKLWLAAKRASGQKNFLLQEICLVQQFREVELVCSLQVTLVYIPGWHEKWTRGTAETTTVAKEDSGTQVWKLERRNHDRKGTTTTGNLQKEETSTSCGFKKQCGRKRLQGS